MSGTEWSHALVDGFTAVGLGACAIAAMARRGRTPVDRPFVFVLVSAALFYGVRGLFHGTGEGWLERLSLALASLLPLAALILAETLLRRHAPRLLKYAILAGAAFSLVVAATGPLVRDRMLDFSLLAYVGGGLVAVFLLAATRKGEDLAPQENADVASLSRGLLVILLLLVTDFGIISPVGLSGVGALVLAYIAASGVRNLTGAVCDLTAVIVAAGLLSAGLLILTGSEIVLVVAPTLAALLALAVVLRLQATSTEQRRGRFLRALAAAPSGSLATFLQTMSEQPLLSGMVVAEGAALAGYSDEGLKAAFGADPLRAATGLVADGGEGSEQLIDLLERNACTHAVLLTASPLRIALVPAGAVRRPWDDESDLLAFQRVGSLVAGRMA